MVTAETMQPITAEALAIQICEDKTFQAALTSVIKSCLDEDCRASTPEEIRQASAEYKAGRLQTFSREEVRREVNALAN
ncbi:MAG: hypothetical protein FWG02_02060 [Holophagaceae bacterium]|nr:hypothetical protein [Holophagaceae bacterium]